MASSDDLNPQENSNPADNKAETEKKSEPRRRKSEAKKADMNARREADGESGDTDAGNAEAGKALAPAGASPIDPFLAAKIEDKGEAPLPPRSFASRALDYSAHAAIIIGLIGFAWTVSDHVIGRQTKTDGSVAAKSQAPGKLDEMGELRLANMKMHEDMKALKASVDAMRTASRRDTTPEQLRMLSAGLDNVKTSVGAAKSETSAAIAQLQAKVDKLGASKMQALADRVARLEHQGVDTASTGSIARSEPQRADLARADNTRSDAIHSDSARAEPSKPTPSDPAKMPPKPPVKPASLASLEDDNHNAPDESKPTMIQGWVVRDVYQGVALIEGKRGTLEVVPGVSIPGAGVVKSIERKGSGWVVTTSKGQLAYGGAPVQREQRDYRRGGGGYGGGGYGRYRDDY